MQRVAKLQNVLTGAKILTLVSFIVLAFTIGNGDWHHFSMPAVRTSANSIPTQFVLSLFFIYLAYSGWNAATYVAEELKQPARTLPLALTVGTILVAALYVGLNLVFIYAVPLENLKGETAVGALAASRLFGPQVAGIFAGLMALSLMSTVNAMVTIGPRVYYAMAKNRAFLASAAKVHPRWHTPVAAIVAQGVCAMLMTLTPFPQLAIYIGFTSECFRGDERGRAHDLPAARGLAEAARGQLCLSADPGIVHPGRHVDDHPRCAIQTHDLAGSSGDARDWRGGLSLPPAGPPGPRADGRNLLISLLKSR